MIAACRFALLFLALMFVAGCSGEKLSTEVIPLGPISSEPIAKNATAISSSSTATKPGPSAPLGTLIRRAERSVESKNLPAAIQALEEAVAVEPTNRKALRFLAEVTQRFAMDTERPRSSPFYLRSAEVARVLRSTPNELTTEDIQMLPLIFYNEACTLAQNGETARAVKALSEALETGFQTLERIDNDEELDPIRKIPEFIALQKGLEMVNIAALMAQTASTPFKFDFRLPDLDGKPLALESLKGKIVIVDIWGTWCPPCRKEIPHFAALYQKYHDKGLEIVGINYENDTSEEAVKRVKAFIKDQAIPYPCVIGDDATRNQILGFEGFPTTLFLDREGKVRLKLTGYHSIIPLETAVEKLMASGQPESPARN